MASRLYFNQGIGFLEQLFDNGRDDVEALQIILDELEYRSTARAESLKEQVLNALSVVRACQKPEKSAASQRYGLSDEPQQPDSFENIETRKKVQESNNNENEDLIALTEADIHDAFKWLVSELDLRSFLVEGPSFIIRTYQWIAIKDPPAKPLLNSFFLHDLTQATQDIEEGTAGSALRRYLGLDAIKEKIDILNDNGALESLTAPGKAPTGRWPGQGRHSLVLLQQAAVNIARHEFKKPGIMGINGPPGTGKTTLLRDLVASVLIDRAEALAKFDKPEEAFHHSGKKIRIGQAFCRLYRLDDSIKGHEMLVASSNNKAVENISKELPDRDALAEDSSLTYFKTISDEASDTTEGNATWGLIAAVLGNASNRYAFRKAIWDNDDTSLKHYLKAALGNPVPPIEEEDPDTGELIERTQRILMEEDVPSGPAEALKNWKIARKSFLKCQKKVCVQLSQIEEARGLAKKVGSLRLQLVNLENDMCMLENRSLKAQTIFETAKENHEASAKKLYTAQNLLNTSLSTRPGFLPRLFRTQRYLDWRTSNDDLTSRFQVCVAEEEKVSEILHQAKTKCLGMDVECKNLKENIDTQRHAIEQVEQTIQKVVTLLGPHFADDKFWNQDHGDRHKATPWLSSEVQRLRDETFEAAVRLHRAFIDAAAKPLRHNLMALFHVFRGGALNTPEKAALLPELWATLFLITPVISTTFASVERMLSKLPNESLGWLFIDEAGQAVPQAAVGAIKRSKRALIIGDPLQIPPVVMLSPTLVGGISREFGVDTDIWAAPQASAQSLADNASRYGTELERDTGSIWIGSPLLVHRRCENPMFKISNRIAYNGLMVHAVSEKPSQIRDVLGCSSWFDIPGAASDKWCADEGHLVSKLLHRLHQSGIQDPDIYIISPFRIVAQRMRDLVRIDDVLMSAWTDNPWKWVSERIGTVHTFQGKEAEAVILLLGAPNVDQTGARNWAGGEPNLLNVAATRAKSALYVVGARERWKSHGHFQTLNKLL